MPRLSLRAAPPAGSPEPISAARRNLLLLSVVAVLGIVVAATIGVVAGAWTLQALRDADLAAGALRVHTQVDMMHDMMRSDVFAKAVGVKDADEEFKEHADEMREGIERLERMPLPPAVQERIRAEETHLRAFAAAGRKLLEQDTPLTLAQLEAYSGQWRALEEPMDATGDALQDLVKQAETAGGRSRSQGLLWSGIALLVLLALVAVAASRLSRAVLQANLQLVAANQSRSDFLASMSHEIRTPMTGVLGMVDLLAGEDLAPAQRREYLNSMRSSGQHLLAVINDILDFTRIESGKLQLEQVDFSLAELLEQLRSLLNPLAVERGLDLQIHLAQPAPAVLRGDPTRLRQIVLNLASNALKFTERGSVRIEVTPQRTAAAQWRLRCEVRDTGVGIAPDAVPGLFTPFRQADQSISRRYGGSGLGLAICKRLVEAMGGEIGVQSTPGAGSLFFFELPLPEGDARDPASSAEQLAVAGQPRRILVAEDVEINREILRRGLERAGHEPVFANDGTEAVKLAREQDFDLILMDVQMPVMDGIEATRRIRGLGNGNSEAPILALTANVMAQERASYLAAGMDECLMKPIEWEHLLAAIDRHTRTQTGPAPLLDVRPPTEAPLVDQGTQASLVEMGSRDVLKEWLQLGMTAYEAACSKIAGGNVDAATVAKEAHKIKGSAGTLGLPRLHTVSAAVEQSAKSGQVDRARIAQLRAALDDTRRALQQSGLL